MFLQNKALGLLRRLRFNRVGEARVAVCERIGVNHRDAALGDSGDHKLALDPHANHRECCHEVTLKEPADDLREAARYMRSTLCYGGSADPFYRAIAEWWDREAGQAERSVAPGFSGVADDLAVKSARAYLPGARAWLHENGAYDPSVIKSELDGDA